MKSERILIVEDEMIISATIEGMLNKLGYANVETAFNAKRATELIQKNDYDLILMDIRLGQGPDGIDVVSKFKESKDIPVIYVTGNSDPKTLDKAKVTTPYGFITKPVTEPNLKVQLELTLYKEKIKKAELQENNMIQNLYEGDCSGLSITLNLEGGILEASHHIKKITGKASYMYKSKNIALAGFSKDFYELLARSLTTAKNTAQRDFFGSIYSPFIGQRMVKVNAIPHGFFSFTFMFTDVTDETYKKDTQKLPINIAIASTNEDIMRGFKNIPELIPSIRIAAELYDADAIEQYMKSGNSGVLMLDVGMDGIPEVLRENYALKNDKLAVALMLSTMEAHKLKTIDTAFYSGYFSKTAGDATLMEGIEQLMKNKKFYDAAIKKNME